MTDIEKIKEIVKSNLERINALPEDEKQAEAAKYFLALGSLSALDSLLMKMNTEALMKEAQNSIIAAKAISVVARYKSLGADLGYCMTKEEHDAMVNEK